MPTSLDKSRRVAQLSGDVYLMRAASYYKIGYSSNVEQRRQGVKDSAMPLAARRARVSLVHTIHCQDMRATERALHHRFSHKRVRGEWYRLSPEDVQWFRAQRSDPLLDDGQPMDDQWMEADAAAALLGRTERQLLRYATSRRIQTRRVGRRLQYARADVEQLAGELEQDTRTRPANVAPEMGRALVETLGIARELIEAQREIMRLRERVQVLEQQRAAAIRIIGDLVRKRAK